MSSKQNKTHPNKTYVTYILSVQSIC